MLYAVLLDPHYRPIWTGPCLATRSAVSWKQRGTGAPMRAPRSRVLGFFRKEGEAREAVRRATLYATHLDVVSMEVEKAPGYIEPWRVRTDHRQKIIIKESPI